MRDQEVRKWQTPLLGLRKLCLKSGINANHLLAAPFGFPPLVTYATGFEQTLALALLVRTCINPQNPSFLG